MSRIKFVDPCAKHDALLMVRSIASHHDGSHAQQCSTLKDHLKFVCDEPKDQTRLSYSGISEKDHFNLRRISKGTSVTAQRDAEEKVITIKT
jgi:hypothetical protein